jgi:hypothetical protein
MAVGFLIILAISVILFIVSVALGAKVWRVPTLLTVIGLFLAGLVFFVLAACVLQSHKHWRDVARTLESQIKKEGLRRAQLIGGVWGDQEDLTATESSMPTDGEPPTDTPPAETPPESTEPATPTDAPVTDQPADTTTKEPEAKTDESAKDDAAAKEDAAPKEPEKKEEPKTEPPPDEKMPEEKAPEQEAPDEKASEAKPEEAAEKLSAAAPLAYTLAPQDEETKDDAAQPKPDDAKSDDAKPDDAKPKEDQAEEAKPAEPKPEEKTEADPAEKKEQDAKPADDAADQPKEDMPKDAPKDAPVETPAQDDAAVPDAQAPSDVPPSDEPTSDVPGDTSPAPPGPELRRMGIEQLKQQIRQLREDRGRIWEGQGKFSGNGAAVTVTIPDPHNISPNTILYAFEKKDQGLFLGEFKVTNVADKVITLESTVTLTEDEKKRYAGRDGDWILSDKPPVDSHEAFAGLPREELIKLLPAKSADVFANPDTEHAALVAEFENDGKTAQEAGIKSGDANDPRSQRVFARVEVLEEFEAPQPAGAKAPPAGEPTDPPRARPGRTAIVDRETAAELAKQNKVKVIEEVYVRPLRRYELYWHAAHDRRLELDDRIKQLAGQAAAMKSADAAAQEVKKQREKEKAELQADQSKLAADRDVAKKHAAELAQAEQALQTAIKEAFVKNRSLAAELTRTQVGSGQTTSSKAAAASGTAR